MSAPKPLDWRAILEQAGADSVAAEGTQGHSLFVLESTFAEVIAAAGSYFAAFCQDEADDELVRDPDGRKCGMWSGCSEEQHIAAERLASALGSVEGGLPA